MIGITTSIARLTQGAYERGVLYSYEKDTQALLFYGLTGVICAYLKDYSSNVFTLSLLFHNEDVERFYGLSGDY